MRLLKVFVAKSFSPEDREKNEAIEAVLDRFKPLGLIRITAEAAEIESVSHKVRDKIDNCDLFLAIFTRRHRIMETRSHVDLAEGGTTSVSWTAAPWLFQECGYALKAGKKLMLFFENGVEKPALQGDLEYITFDGSAPTPSINRLLDMLPKFLAEHSGHSVVDAVTNSAAGQASSENSSAEPTVSVIASAPDPSPLSEDFDKLFEAWRNGDLEELKKAQASGLRLLGTQPDRISPFSWNCLALQFRGKVGDRDALQELRSMAECEDTGHNAAEAYGALAGVAHYVDDHKSAGELYGKAAMADPPAYEYLLKAAKEYRLAKQEGLALSQLVTLSALPGLPNQIRADSYKELFRIHKGKLPGFCFGEAALTLDPVDAAFRFDLAYSYSEAKAAFGQNYRDLAAYHYQFCAEKNGDVNAVNNLGVVYQELDLPIHAIRQFVSASQNRHARATANILHQYLAGGFIEDAKRIGKEMAEDDSEGSVIQAVGAIHSNRAAEEAKIAAVRKYQDVHRQGLARLAEIGVVEPSRSIEGIWSFQPTKLHLRMDSQATINGSGEISGGLGTLASIFGKTLFKFTATRLASSIWRYKTERKPEGDNVSWSEVSSGLLAFSAGGRAATVLEYPATGSLVCYEIERLDVDTESDTTEK